MASKRGKQAYRENERQSWPAWVWLGLGILLGLLLSAVMLMKDWVPSLRKSNSPQPNPNATAPKEAEQAVVDDAARKPLPPPPKKTFDFYHELAEREVMIPDAELSAKARAEQQRQQQAAAQAQTQAQNPASAATTASPATPPAETGARYFLLAGSYTDAKAADEAKAKLAFLGIVAKIQSITVNDKVYNRVLVGPYASASETEAAKKTLAENSIKSVPITAARSP
jgi:cell division protein FtsN